MTTQAKIAGVIVGLGIAGILVYLFLLLGGCTMPLTVAPKPVTAHAIAFDKNTQNAGIIDCDKSGCLVTANFVARYRAMEAGQPFMGDANIVAVGGNYRMPYDCVEHFTTMKAATRGGQ